MDITLTTTTTDNNTATTTIAITTNSRNDDHNHSHVPFYGVSEECYYLALVAMATLVLVAVLGNVSNITVIVRSSSLRHSLSNFFVLSLCVADLLAATAVMPMAVVTFALGESPLNEVACGLVGFATSLFMFVSLTTLTAISVERYYSIRLPMHHAANMSFCKTLGAIVCVWLWSALLAALPMIGVGSYEYNYSRSHCSFGGPRDDRFQKVYVALVATVFFLVPGLILVAMYVGIFKVARQAAIQIRPLRSEASRATASVTNTGLFYTRASKDDNSAPHGVLSSLRSCRRISCKTAGSVTSSARGQASWAIPPRETKSLVADSGAGRPPNPTTRTVRTGGGSDRFGVPGRRSIADGDSVNFCQVQARKVEPFDKVKHDKSDAAVVDVVGGGGGGGGRGCDGSAGEGCGSNRPEAKEDEIGKVVVVKTKETANGSRNCYGYKEDSGIASQESVLLPPPLSQHPPSPPPPPPLHFLPPPLPSLTQRPASSLTASNTSQQVELRANTLRPVQGHLKAAKTLLLLLLAYTVLWGPFFVSHLHGVVEGSFSRPEVTNLVSLWLGFASFAVNPFLYGWMNKAIREELVQLYRRVFCGCCVRCGSRPEVVSEDDLFQAPSNEDFFQFLERTSGTPRSDPTNNSQSVVKPEISVLNVESSDPF